MNRTGVNEAAVATDFSQFAGLRAAAKRNDPKALRQAAQQFEALFTEMVLKGAHQTKFGDDLTGEQGDLYQDMFDQQMAMHLSAGKGLGLADLLVRQLGGLHGADAGASAPQAASAVPAPAAKVSGTGSSGNSVKGSAAVPKLKLPQSVQEFVDTIRPHAEKAAALLGIPARALIAQAALETGWGQHLPKQTDGSVNVNLFGVKAQPGWNGPSQMHQTAEFQSGQWTSEPAKFRSYNSVGASFDGYVSFLQANPRYAEALRSGDVHGYAQGLQTAGYATDPQYAQKLIKIAFGPQLASAYDVHPITSA